MEGASSTNGYKGFRGYWNRRRRGYEKLHGSASARPSKGTADFELVSSATDGGSTHYRKRRFAGWRIKITPRLKLKFRFSSISPKKFLIGLRDAYVNFMNRIANSRVIAGGVGGGYGGNAVVGGGFGVRTLKEYDEKMIIEIYKSLVIAQGQLAPRDAAKLGNQVVCPR